jgi:hypothetical protein
LKFFFPKFLANCVKNFFSKLSIAPTPQLSDKLLQYLTCSTSAPNPTEPFTKDELNFLKSRNLIVDLQNCVEKGTFGSLYVALSHQFGYVVLKRYESYSQASNEAEVLRIFGGERPHPNLIQYDGCHLYRNHLYLLLEYSNVGDLDRFYIDFYSNRQPFESEIFQEIH